MTAINTLHMSQFISYHIGYVQCSFHSKLNSIFSSRSFYNHLLSRSFYNHRLSSKLTQRYFLLGCPIKGKKWRKCPNEFLFFFFFQTNSQDLIILFWEWGRERVLLAEALIKSLTLKLKCKECNNICKQTSLQEY